MSQLVEDISFNAMQLMSFAFLSSLLFPCSFPFLSQFHLGFCSLGLLCRKTLIECLLMLWPLCLHPAFSAALIPSTHCKVCRTSVRLPRRPVTITSAIPHGLLSQCSHSIIRYQSEWFFLLFWLSHSTPRILVP